MGEEVSDRHQAGFNHMLHAWYDIFNALRHGPLAAVLATSLLHRSGLAGVGAVVTISRCQPEVTAWQ